MITLSPSASSCEARYLDLVFYHIQCFHRGLAVSVSVDVWAKLGMDTFHSADSATTVVHAKNSLLDFKP